jgi:ethanolamine ammonia-lyase small subunit
MDKGSSDLSNDPRKQLRRLTPARVALGREGGSVPTSELLKFQLDHARARDAVHAEFDPERLQGDITGLGLEVVQLTSQAGDRQTYLLRPDLGRMLSEESGERLKALTGGSGGFDLSIVLSDGLSALAAYRQIPMLMAQLVPSLRHEELSIGPVAVVRFGRVAVQDQIGEILNARVSVILLGERPGLLSADSLGAYLVYGPRIGRTDAERNCVSNIRAEGLSPAAAAGAIHYLITQSLRRQISGVGLKDERSAQLP